MEMREEGGKDGGGDGGRSMEGGKARINKKTDKMKELRSGEDISFRRSCTYYLVPWECLM